ncbi:ESPR-type extended signal peptide-containing protein, partial [Snodgrassella sp. CS2]|uniref:ESPR-type extended signal peptide-containing protein n=1 Tax=Snodgrassella sp. CS2 TaxID=3418953 RepID=UPI003D082BFD
MNIIYKSKWSESTNTWVACSELVRGKTKNDCSKIVVAITLALASLSTYAACDPIINADTNYPDIQATSGDQCNLDAEQIYNRITAKQGSKISGTNITADGPKKGSAQSISLVGDSELEADNITTTNTRPGSSSQAFYQNKSKSTIHQDLNANNTGVAASSEILKNVNGSTLEIGRNLTIKDNSTTGSSYNTIYNENSQINVNGDINIDNTGVKDSSTKANTAINNVGGKISANNVVIKQNGTASSISQQSKGDPDTLIDIKGNLDIDSTTSLSSITVNGGKISVGKNTNIIKKAEEKDTAVIGITAGGTFESKGDTTMTINSADTSETDITASGVSIGADSKYINHGNLKVNNGQNTIITSDEDLADGEIATFDNTTTAKTSSAVDTVVHKGRGTLVVNNDGVLESTNNEKGSVLSNQNEGVLEATNSNILSGNIKNNSKGKIVLQNTGKVNEDGNGSVNPNQIINNDTGSIAIINNNTMGGNIINKGGLRSTDNISVENNKNLTSHIKNDGAGSILVNNNASSNLSGDIENTQTGKITLNNKGN